MILLNTDAITRQFELNRCCQYFCCQTWVKMKSLFVCFLCIIRKFTDTFIVAIWTFSVFIVIRKKFISHAIPLWFLFILSATIFFVVPTSIGPNDFYFSSSRAGTCIVLDYNSITSYFIDFKCCWCVLLIVYNLLFMHVLYSGKLTFLTTLNEVNISVS